MMEINGAERLRFGSYEADLHTHELWKHGTRMKLVGQPFDILAVMLTRPGQLITRDELRAELWPGDTFVDFNHGLNAAVNKLRDALCDSADDPKYIETLPRRGYRFIAAVEKSAAGTSAEPTGNQSGQPISIPRSAATLSSVSPVVSAIASEVTYVPAFESGKLQPRNLRWLRYPLLALTLALGLWRLADLLHSTLRDRAKLSQESAVPSGVTPLTALSDRTSEPAFSPDGTRVAFRRESFVPGNSGIWVKQIGGEQLVQLTNGDTDCSPVWSPDGHYVAFSRLSGTQRAIYEVAATGGTPRTMYSTNLVPGRTQIDWSPDGRTIAFTAMGRQGSPAIFVVSSDLRARQITAPAQADQDWGPAFSPDGGRIVFVRMNDLMVMPADGGELHRLTPSPMRIIGAPAWSPDGLSIIFGAENHSALALWRIPATGGIPAQISQAGERVWNPAVSKRGFHLAFELVNSARSIDQLDLDPPGQKPRTLVTAVSGENAGQQLSPDGKKLAFQSDRTGSLDIWVSDRNGQNPIQLTAMGTAGAPRWSPDGKEIAFDVGLGRDWREPRAIFVIDADGGTPRPLVQDSFSNNVPSWSRDGDWIYFASNRLGNEWQVWKIKKSGGAPVQVTTRGGFASIESPDGKYLYYAKHNLDEPEIWRVPVAGGPETPLFPGIRPLDWGAWTVVEDGIIFAEAGEKGPTVNFYDFAGHSVKQLAVLDRDRPFWVTASNDAKSILFDQPGQDESHIMLLENFH